MNKPIHRYKLFWLLLLLTTYFLVGYFYIPISIKQQMISQLSDQFDMQTELESVSFNPFSFQIDVKGLKITDANQQPWFYSQQVGINFDPTKLLWNEWKFSNLNLVHPQIIIHTNDQGQVLIPALPEFPEVNDNQGINASIDQIQISQGNIDLRADNIKNGFKLTIKDFEFSQDQLVFIDKDTHFKVNITTEDDELINLNGSYNHSQNLINTELQLIDLKINTLEHILPDDLFISQTTGTIKANGNMNWNLTQNPEIKFSNIELQSLHGQFHNDISIQNLSFNIQDVMIDTESHQVVIEQIDSANGDWQINWPFSESLLQQASPAQTHIPAELIDLPHTTPSNWQVTINQTNIQSWSLELIDHDLNQQLDLQIQSLDMHQTNNINQPFSISSQIEIQNQGSIDISSDQTLSPLNLKASIKASQLSLQPFAPWIKAQSGLVITQGQLNSEQKITIENNHLMSSGNLAIIDGHINDQYSTPIASWSNLQVGAISVSSQNRTLTFDQITVSQAKGNIQYLDAQSTQKTPVNKRENFVSDWKVIIGSIKNAKEESIE